MIHCFHRGSLTCQSLIHRDDQNLLHAPFCLLLRLLVPTFSVIGRGIIGFDVVVLVVRRDWH